MSAVVRLTEHRLCIMPDGTAVAVEFQRNEPIAYRPLWRAQQGKCVLPHAPAANDR